MEMNKEPLKIDTTRLLISDALCISKTRAEQLKETLIEASKKDKSIEAFPIIHAEAQTDEELIWMVHMYAVVLTEWRRGIGNYGFIVSTLDYEMEKIVI